jgi:DNA-binding XRE family transcriptional regulator
MVAAMTLMESPLLRPKPSPETPLARWLKRSGYTATELAAAVGVNKGTISRIARRKVAPSLKLEQKIKKATGLQKL